MSAPKLRFKEFTDKWKLDQVGKFLIEYKEKVPSSTDIEVYSSSRDGLKPQKEYFDNRELQNFGEYGVVPPNYFTYRHMSDDTTFKFNINLVGRKVAVSKEYPVFTTNEFLDSSFLLLKLNESNDFKKFAIEQKKGGTRTRLYFKSLCTWETLLPAKAEQTKIASFLSAVDEKIAQLTQKHELLSQYKQGMMQKLFSQQIRFRADDGSEFGEWEETELGKHCQIKTGKLDANAMRPNGEFRFYTCAKEFYLIDEYAFDTEALLISGNGANVGYIHYYKGKFNAYQRTYVLDQWQQNIIFIQYFLEQFLKERIYGEKKEGNTPYIVLSTLSEMPLLLPCLAEQTKIANFLSAIDQKIEVVAQQIEQAKTWKKGLLQQMFV